MFVGVKYYRPPFMLVFPREFVHTLNCEESCGHSLQAFVFQFVKSDSISFLESKLFGQDWPIFRGKMTDLHQNHASQGNLFAWWVTLLIDVFFQKVQLIIHPAFVKLASIVFEQNVKYPQVFGALIFQIRKATKTEGLSSGSECRPLCWWKGHKTTLKRLDTEGESQEACLQVPSLAPCWQWLKSKLLFSKCGSLEGTGLKG